MTSTTGTDEHPEVAEISALTEGVLSPARSVHVREHLADCALCEDVRSSLDEIRGLLGTLPGPARMPVDVAERIDAALAAEALLDATTPLASAPLTTDDVSRETADSREAATGTLTQPPVSRETTTAGPTAQGGGPSRPAGRPRAATGPGRQKPARRPRRWSRALLGTACAAAVIGVGSLFLPGGSDRDTHAGPPAPGTSRTASGFASGDLATNVRDLLRTAKPNEPRGKSAQNSPETMLRDVGTTPPVCVREGIGRTDNELAARPETYDGKDAFLIVLPHPGDTTLVDAYVVSSACDADTSAPRGKVLLNRTLRRD
ncbi:hypothetical protein AB0K09_00325 [Streptomyces sp. NPDC049577]|uniref:hypothetical protein n=1 Tax=Streptomyces sp. NPDC049577 TaxID=3155153 RepID=UPI00342C46D1